MGGIVACLLVAGLMPYLFTAIAKASGKRFDNRDPRAWQAGLSGFPQRAHAAHLNSFEAFPLFAVGVLFCLQQQIPAATVLPWAIAFVALRLGFGVCYLLGWATLRSLVWLAAIACAVRLYFLPLH
ncbi:MAPEG family protein [Pseudomarimonas salicorniae]|uniref:MAPEG family protein n=1 Tax=Pseudomarimonas salicorniae TaxID=2933270 RepID=A0ABT0GD34_9GAMM|nr:MAPEG family protein [Lysobacter sp. CAU 1642]MCK7592094.1 MAPEG family protein [Lysobacter sp. CAU 1642]